MKSIKIMLAVAILGLIGVAGAQAQTVSGTPGAVIALLSSTAVTTGTLNAEQVLSGSAAALVKAQDWPDLMTMAAPFVSENYIYDPGVNGWNDVGLLNNQAIGYMITGTSKLAGVQAAHDYAVSKLAWTAAAGISGGPLRNPQQAITEFQNAINLSTQPNSANSMQPQMLLYQAKAGQNVNSAIMTFLNSQTAYINGGMANNLYSAFNYIAASKTDTLAFFSLLLQSVESNQANAAFVGKIIDQENKLNAK